MTGCINIESGLFYGARHKDADVVLNSRSGGVFTALSDVVLSRSGVVYGVFSDNNDRVRYMAAKTAEERNLMRGSKYVQSDKGKIFCDVLSTLRENKHVLFAGVPCEVAGLRSFLAAKNAPMDKLFLVDILCHSSPSPKVWADYVDFIERKYKSPVKKAIFRDKERFGWADHRETFILEDGRAISTTEFRYLFYREYIVRPSCYECKYKGKYSGDIVVGDLWGVEKVCSQLNDNKGANLVIPNSDKGVALISAATECLEIYPVEREKVMQRALVHPSDRPADRDRFWNCYAKHGIKRAVKKYASDTFKVRFKRAIRRLIRGK